MSQVTDIRTGKCTSSLKHGMRISDGGVSWVICVCPQSDLRTHHDASADGAATRTASAPLFKYLAELWVSRSFVAYCAKHQQSACVARPLTPRVYTLTESTATESSSTAESPGTAESPWAPSTLVQQQQQGLRLVHFSAQLERLLWDRGARRDCEARVKGV